MKSETALRRGIAYGERKNEISDSDAARRRLQGSEMAFVLGRIPKALTAMGAELYYGNQDSWARVEDNAKTIRARIRQILEDSGAEKINIIAHSKGRLEAHMAASSLGMGKAVASITTVGTPHRGSKTIDRLLKAPDSLFNIASFAVNDWIGLIGDTKPNFYAVCRDFSTDYAEQFNRNNPNVTGVYYQSFCRSDENTAVGYQFVESL